MRWRGLADGHWTVVVLLSGECCEFDCYIWIVLYKYGDIDWSANLKLERTQSGVLLGIVHWCGLELFGWDIDIDFDSVYNMYISLKIE